MARPSSTATSHLLKISQDIMAHLSPDSGPQANRPRAGRTGLDIKIENHWTSKAYTSGSTINGHVVVNAQRDVPFDDLEIQFTGTAYTRVDFVNQYATYASRAFMKLRMPIRASDFPNPRVFEAGRTYTIPFHFVVPHQLTLSACSHHVDNPAVRDAHLRLPPTMGLWEVNDQAPEMAQIEYSIRAAAFHDGAMALEGFHLVKVLPSLPEDAPLEITSKDERYQLSKTKTIRKNLFSAKQGKLSATAVQPSAIMLSADGLRASESLIRVNLDFDPATPNAVPPKINSVTAKLQSTTFFSNAPMNHLPNMGSRVKYQSSPCLTYSTNTAIAISPIDTVSWQQESEFQRRDSGYSSSAWPEEESSDSDSHSHSNRSAKSPNRQVSALDIPFTLPMGNKKFFLPTFQSCISGRSYFLNLTLSVGPSNTNFNLIVPLQIGVENIYDLPQGDLPSFESAMAEAEQEAADFHLQPRMMHVPSEQYQQTSTLPGYDELRRPTIAAA
ncbi:hypothetical protein EDB80DRAFT_705795 [Ilyonectria destructans]|nr:hypothetical protein EDB80DRAFT_705795 [Ilyonectria destructans]